MKNKIATVFVTILLSGCGMPNDLGVSSDGQLKLPPSTPNCISSQASIEDKEHYMQPWTYDDPKETMQKLVQCIDEFGDTEIILSEDNYIQAVFTTGWMRWQDDVEFYLDTTNKLVHFRSASRIGYGDHGVNRKRMERLKELYNN